MRWAWLASTVVSSGLLAACGPAPHDDAARPASGTASKVREESVFEDVTATQDRARAVEAAAARRQLEMQRALEQAEGK
jgi:hypothetical protein